MGYMAPLLEETTAELALKADLSDSTLIVLEQSTPAQWHRRGRDIGVLPTLTFDVVEKKWNELLQGVINLGVPVPAGTEYELADQLLLPKLLLVRVEGTEQA